MNDHEVFVKNAVLHILDTNVGTPVLSNKAFGPEEDAVEFIENLVQRMLSDDRVKLTNFLPAPNRIQELCREFAADPPEFVETSQELAAQLFEIMTHHPEIPPADLICCLVSIDGNSHLGLFKLNYRTNYIHHVQYEDETQVNRLIKQKTVLPGENQRLEEAAIVSLDDFSIRLIEKEYEIDGEKTNYLSKLFLGCGDKLSAVEKAKIISQVTEKMSKKHCAESFDGVVRMRKTVVDNMDQSNLVRVDSVAREIFRDDPGAQQEFLEEIHNAGIHENEIQLSEKITDRKFRQQKIKTDTGIEINFPATLYENPDMIEFINNPNGTISILIKNISKISNK